MPGRLTAGAGRRTRLPLEWGCAKRAQPGAAACGDAEAVKEFAGGLLVGVMDGLGRGQEAVVAAQSAVQVLRRYGRQPLTGLAKRCHRTLMMTRGAALSLASFRLQEDQTVRFAWLGVGNVEGLLVRGNPETRPVREHLPLHAGVAGYYLPQVRETVRPFEPGDTLIVSTDGIRSDFERELNLHQPTTALAAGILEGSFRGTDDALVLVVRYAESEAATGEEEEELAEARPRRHQALEAQGKGRHRPVKLPRRGRRGTQPADAAASEREP